MIVLPISYRRFFMETVALSSKGQFVLPKTIRDRHNWSTGTEFMVFDRGGAVVLKPVKPFAETSFESPDAQSVYSGPPLSCDNMDQVVAIEAGRHK
jgi:AbrB family looped-hinge helix DNA binding protein